MAVDSQIRGIAFPFRIDSRSGGVAIAEGADKLRKNLEHLLLTRTGERVMLRSYGGGVTRLLHENINDGLIAVARHQITKAILQFEPRVLPQEVSVISKNDVLWLRVRYILAGATSVQTALIPIL